MKDNVVEIEKKVKIGNFILEKGDKIKVLDESISQDEIVRGTVRDTEVNVSHPQAKKDYGMNDDDIIGWFANKYNIAFGWTIYKADEYTKKEFGHDVFRTYSEKTNSLNVAKFNLLKGTYAFIDNEAYEEKEIIKFQPMTKYDRIYIEPTEKAFKEFNIK